MLNQLWIYLLCIVPIFIILTYIFFSDKKEKEPPFLLVILYLGGIVSCILSSKFQNFMKYIFTFLNKPYLNMNIFEIIFNSLIVISISEEFFKWILNYFIVRKNKNFNHIFDPIVYCVFTSLGFATIENVLYGFSLTSNEIAPIIMRGIISVPSHAMFGVYMGYYIGISRNAKIHKKNKASYKYLTLSIIVPCFLHFIYDLCLMRPNIITYIIFIMFVILNYVYSFNLIKRLSNTNQMLEKDILNT